MVGISAHGLKPFDVPFISEIVPDLWVGGCEDGLILPRFIDNLVSVYPWEHYTVNHELAARWPCGCTTASIRLSIRWTAIAMWVNACRAAGPTLVHCQAGLNRSSLVIARALILSGMTARDAIDLIREKRSPVCLSNPSFEKWLLAA